MSTWGRRRAVLALTAITAIAGDLLAQAVSDPVDLEWSLVPPILPPGARIAVVSGDPTMPGMTTVELIMPSGYRMPPHSHPVDEFVEVKEGTLLVGIGDEMDLRKTLRVEVGDTGTAPAGAHHYTIAEGTTRIRSTFMGPYTITYIHADQAPRPPNFPYGY